jgi:hypothetical protein
MTTDPAAPSDRTWPIGIAVALAIFVIVQVTFAFVAVRNADTVVPSYGSEER